MKIEERIHYLLRAARRAETEGDSRAARAFRRMAEEALPVEVNIHLPARHPALGSYTE